MIATTVVMIRVVPDFYINGWDRSEKVIRAREATAFIEFKPSTPLEDKYFGYNLSDLV